MAILTLYMMPLALVAPEAGVAQQAATAVLQAVSTVQHPAVGLQHAAESCSPHLLTLTPTLVMLAGMWVWHVYLLPYIPAARAAASASTTPSPPAADPVARAVVSASATPATGAAASSLPTAADPVTGTASTTPAGAATPAGTFVATRAADIETVYAKMQAIVKSSCKLADQIEETAARLSSGPDKQQD